MSRRSRGRAPVPVDSSRTAAPNSALCAAWPAKRTDSSSMKPGLGRVPVRSSVPESASPFPRFQPPTKLAPPVWGSKMASRRGSNAPARVSTTITPCVRSPKRTDGTPRITSTRSSVAAGMRRRSMPPPALEGMRIRPRRSVLWRLALLETGTPSSTMRVPNDASCAADGSPSTRLGVELVGAVRSENCSTSSSPGDLSATPGMSSSSPDRELAV